MTPFSKTLEKLRRSRNISQTALASLVGVRANYISTLEKSRKLPSESLLEKIIFSLDLDEEEAGMLRKDANISRFSLKAPATASREEFELLYSMKDYIGNLTTIQIDLMKIALKIGGQSKMKERCDMKN